MSQKALNEARHRYYNKTRRWYNENPEMHNLIDVCRLYDGARQTIKLCKVNSKMWLEAKAEESFYSLQKGVITDKIAKQYAEQHQRELYESLGIELDIEHDQEEE